jgi:hypothetical protein
MTLARVAIVLGTTLSFRIDVFLKPTIEEKKKVSSVETHTHTGEKERWEENRRRSEKETLKGTTKER